MGLAARRCGEETAAPLDEPTRERLRNQLPGWRIVQEGLFGPPVLCHTWNAQVRRRALALCRARLCARSTCSHFRLESGCDVLWCAVVSSQRARGERAFVASRRHRAPPPTLHRIECASAIE